MKKVLLIALLLLGIAIVIYFVLIIKKRTKDAIAKSVADNIDKKKAASDSAEVNKQVYTTSPGLNYSQILSIGSKGEEVRTLQGVLGVTADGDFGPKTQAALEEKYNVKSISLNDLFAKISTKPVGTPATAKDATGKDISNGKMAVIKDSSYGEQYISQLIPKRTFNFSDKIKYDDFTIGKQVPCPTGYEIGIIFDFTNSEVLTIKAGTGFVPTIYYIAKNNQINIKN